MQKFYDIESALGKIEDIDKEIEALLEKEDYGKIIDILKDRLIVISQINQLKQGQGLSFREEKRLKMIFEGGNSIQNKIQIKKDSIAKRLGQKRTIVSQNKKIRYK